MKRILSSLMVLGLTGTAYAADMPYYYTPAKASGVKVGVLTCKIEGGWGLVVVSNKKLHCIFRGAGRRESYYGTITKVGVDLGVTRASSFSWSVIAPSRNILAHDLAGGYLGVSAEATVVAGLGANVLLGGGRNSFALQPVSVQSQSGLNAAAGIAGLSLYPGYKVRHYYKARRR